MDSGLFASVATGILTSALWALLTWATSKAKAATKRHRQNREGR